jgi:hypothetical protein
VNDRTNWFFLLPGERYRLLRASGFNSIGFNFMVLLGDQQFMKTQTTTIALKPNSATTDLFPVYRTVTKFLL